MIAPPLLCAAVAARAIGDRQTQLHDHQIGKICTSPFPVMPINLIINDRIKVS